MDEPVFEPLPQSGDGTDSDWLAWPETQALATALRGYTFEFQMPEYFCPDCVREQPRPGYCGMCSIIRASFPPAPPLGIIAL